jgi:preprotein translocase subunit YajC
MELLLLGMLQADQQRSNPLIGAMPILIMVLLFWVMVIVPQRRQAKAHAAMVQGLQKGDQVVTAGGIIGTITAVRDDQIEVRSGTSTVIVERARVTRTISAGGPAKQG